MTDTTTTAPKQADDRALYEGHCVAGCEHFHGGEVRHHSTCGHYADSLTKVNDDRLAEKDAEILKLRNAMGGAVEAITKGSDMAAYVILKAALSPPTKEKASTN